MSIENESFFDVVLNRIEKANKFIKAIPLVLGILTASYTVLEKSPWLLVIGFLLSCITGVWIAISIYLKRKRRRGVFITPVFDQNSAFIRGLRPFEKGDVLLGRDREKKQALTILKSTDFKFGYISGEAGSGKTSFIRSVLLNQIEEIQQLPIYISSIEGDPINTIRQYLYRYHSIEKANSIYEEFELFKIELSCDIVLVIDQFEEFFITFKMQSERDEIIKALSSLLTSSSKYNTKVLIGLRKDFVDDIQEFSRFITQPTDNKFSMRIYNWEVSTAIQVFKEICIADNLPFSEELCENMIKELAAIDGKVRPVEMQIAAEYALEMSIYTNHEFIVRGGAKGILASYFKEVISPTDYNIPELEKTITQTMLKLLCDEKNNTKRAISLAQSELRKSIYQTVYEGPNRGLIENDFMFDKALKNSLSRLINKKIIHIDNVDSFKLVHDYIVQPIKLATGNIETSNEKADRLLRKYVEDYNILPTTTISWSHYRYIVNNASRNLFDEIKVSELVKRTEKYFVKLAGIFIIIAVVLVIIFSQPRIENDLRTVYQVDSNTWWDIWEDSSVILCKTNDSLIVLNANDLSQTDVTSAESVAYLRTINAVVIRDNNYHTAYKIVEGKFLKGAVISSDNFLSETYNFSLDQSKFLMFNKWGQVGKNNLYVFNSETLNAPLEIISLDNLVSDIETTFDIDINNLYDFKLSPRGTYLTMIAENDKSLFVFRYTINSDSLRLEDRITWRRRNKPDNGVYGRQINVEINLQESLMVIGLDSIVTIFYFDSTIICDNYKTIYLKDDVVDLPLKTFNFNFAFSPAGEWLFASNVDGNCHAIHLTDYLQYKLDDVNLPWASHYTIPFWVWGNECLYFANSENNIYKIEYDSIPYKSPFQPFIASDLSIPSFCYPDVFLFTNDSLAFGCNANGKIFSWNLGKEAQFEGPHEYDAKIYSEYFTPYLYGENVYFLSGTKMIFGKVGSNMESIKFDSDPFYVLMNETSTYVFFPGKVVTLTKVIKILGMTIALPEW